ncbi:MAG: MlaD family protein [Planctomycetaceae bacterium]|nr:MlaD family protein [Planctomycetaceae bacterium]
MADYQTRQRHQNMVVGVFVFLALAAFLWMLWRFRDLPLAAGKLKSFEIMVYFPEVPGVGKDTPVQFCGYQVGRVNFVAPPKRIGNDDQHRVPVEIYIDKQFKDIPSDANIQIVKRGLGSSYIDIRVAPEKQTKPVAFLQQGMVLEGSISTASEFFPPAVQKKLENLVDSISQLANNANAILGDVENQNNVKVMLANLKTATEQANETLKSFKDLSDVSADKAELLGDKLVEMADTFEGTLAEVRRILAKIESGQGTAGKLVNDGRLYENLLESSQELQMALQQLKEWAADARQKGIRIKW